MVVWVLLRSLAAVLVGALIGSERARHGRAAGMRTHILVCLGACMTSMTSVYVSQCLGITGDVFRISAQVISGIGFLGAGMIILKNNNMIAGLTTAAGVWTSGAIGVALGYGFYVGAAVVTLLFLAATVLFAKFERRRKTTEAVYLEVDDLYKVNAVITALRQQLPTDFSCQIIAPKSEKDGNVGISILIEGETDVDVDALCAIDGAAYAVRE